MKRREFLSGLGGAAVLPLQVFAETRSPIVGLIGPNTATAQTAWTAAFVRRLRELGWDEGRNVSLEYRWADGRTERLTEIASELVKLKVDVIVTIGTPAAVAAKEATSAIPIVFIAVTDPVGSKLVPSLARPTNNLTGLSNQQSDLSGKRISLLREIVPHLRTLAILANAFNPASLLDIQEIKTASTSLGIGLLNADVRSAEEIAPALDALKGRADALYIFNDYLMVTHRVRISTLAIGMKMPTIGLVREFVTAGGLISYGSSVPSQFRRSAELVDKILRGAKPGEIPVEQPTQFDLVVNLTTAKAIGLTIPEAFLLRADEVIE